MTQKIKTGLMIGSGIIVVAGVIIGYLMFAQSSRKENNISNTAANDQHSNTAAQSNENSNSIAVNVSQETNNNTNKEPSIALTGIQWKTPEAEDVPDIFTDDYKNNVEIPTYSIGTLTDGEYKGGELLLISAPSYGLGMPMGEYRFIKFNNTFIALTNNSDAIGTAEETGFDTSTFTVNDSLIIEELIYPDNITGPEPRQTLKRYDTNFFNSPVTIFDESKAELAFTHNDLGKVYTTKGYPEASANDAFTWFGYYIKSPDGTTVIYQYVPDFFDSAESGYQIPSVTWTNGSTNAEMYEYTVRTGCGSASFEQVMNPNNLSIEQDLKKTGQNSFGDPVYELKDSNHQLLKSMYEVDYTDWGQGKVSYVEFVANHPAFFWEDPFNRLVMFKSNKFIQAAECAKPAIYLYPESTTNISVAVNPVGGFTYTDPPYNKGWRVTATPSGIITDPVTGISYPYLFWEGSGGIYTQPEYGWVVERANVHRFLNEKLAALGLNEKEIADFQEYWEPKMNSKPWYFITFLGNDAMNQIAPLEVSPAPDSIIRVLMDFSPLDAPKTVRAFPIKTPTRNGFTVVEWGGVIR